MRWLSCTVLAIFCLAAKAQTPATDSLPAPLPGWSSPSYTQEAKIYNGLYLTSLQNPALAGFDRQLVARYGFAVSNTAYNVPDQAASEPAFWQQTALIDFAFAGPRKNCGVTLAYQGGQEWRSEFHKLYLAQSYRIVAGKHNFTIGLGVGYRISYNNATGLVWGDMVDPRYGIIYPTQQPGRNGNQSSGIFALGITYHWKRLLFSYSFTNANGSMLQPAGPPDNRLFHDFFSPTTSICPSILP